VSAILWQSTRVTRRRSPSWWLTSAAVLIGCNGGDDGPASPAEDAGCEVLTEPPALDCAPSFDPPDFTALYDNVLAARCGSPGTGLSCHGPDGAQGDLVLWEPDVAHAYLIGEADGRARVIPGRPECSELMLRVQASDLRVRMPLNGAPLDRGAICAIRHWIADGAEGP
jgi:hypothetical protein